MTNHKHDCDKCRYLGQAKKNNKLYDFYICETLSFRTFIARYGDEPSEYSSNSLFICCELTDLDKIALMSGLELTKEEESRLLNVMLRMYKTSLTLNDYKENCILDLGENKFTRA